MGSSSVSTQPIIDRLMREIQPDEFKRWFAPARFQITNGAKLRIHVPNIFFQTWIADNYMNRIEKVLEELDFPARKIELVCSPEPIDSSESSPPAPDAAPITSEGDPVHLDSSLNHKYRFANFVVGNSNQLAHAASLAVANSTAAYNPLFIYGLSGLGKTHLLNAIGNQLIDNDPDMKVAYLSSEEFTNELIEALRTERMIAFRQKYRNIDALLIDDIHFIGGRERTQEEFFYTFNALYEAGKQIVLCSDRMPKEIPDLEDRLRSRFEGGLFADITSPDRETKVAILSKKAEEEGIALDNDVAFFLAGQGETNIRVLEGYLSRLAAYSSLMKKPIDLETTQTLLGQFLQAEQRQISLDLIIQVTSKFFNVKVSDLKSNKKKKAVAAPRQAAMYLSRQLTPMSTIEIGQGFGGRDHSTVIHAVKKVESKIDQDHVFARSISDLRKAIRDSAAQKEYPQ